MKNYICILILLLIAPAVFANEAFFPTEKGMTQLTANLNSNGRIEGYNLMAVKDVKVSGNDITVIYTVQILDRNRKPDSKAGEREYSVKINAGVLEFELKNMMDAFFAAQNMNYTLTDSKLFIPSGMAPGSKLRDAWMKIVVNVPIIGSVTADVAMTDIVCAGIETVTVPAGTFEAYKVTQTSTTVTKGWIKPTVINTGVTWYVRGIGVVKTISYDDKGKVESSAELHELKRK